MKGWKLWLGLGICIVLAAAGLFGAYVWWLAEPHTVGIEGHTARVERGAFESRVRAAGYVEAPQKARLDFGRAGRVAEILVSEGEGVQAGQVLARLETEDSEFRVAKAEAALRLAQARLALLSAGPSEADLASATVAVEAAESDHDRIKARPLGAQIASAEAALKSAEATYNQLVAGPTSDQLAVAKAAIDRAEIVRQRAQAEYDKYAWKEGFGASPQAAALQQATIDYEQAEASYNLLASGSTGEALERARAQVASAHAQLEMIRAPGVGAELKQAEAQVARAKADLARMRDGPTTEELSIVESQVDQAQVGVEEAQSDLARASLRAPHDGVVLSVGVKPGQSVSPGAPVMTLGDLTQLQVRALVNELYISRIESGQTALVHLRTDPSRPLAGRVRAIVPAGHPVAGTVNYPVSIELQGTDGSAGSAIWPGMDAEVEIVTLKEENALLVPRGALKLDRGGWAIRVLRDGRPQDVSVEIGETQGRLVRVLSGVSEGDEILVGTDTLHTSTGDSRYLYFWY